MNIIHEVTTAATHFSLPSDIIFILLLVAVVAIYTFWRGKSKGVSLIIATYPAILLYQYLPYFKQADVRVDILIFLIILIAVHLIINRFTELDFSFSKLGKAFDSLVLGILSTGLLLWTSYHIVIIASLYAFSPSIAHIFADQYSFWWLVAPLIILFFL